MKKGGKLKHKPGTLDEAIVRQATERLPVKLTQERKHELGAHLAVAVDQLNEAEREKKKQATTLGEEVTAARAEVDRIGYVLKVGEEEALVDCDDYFEWKKETMTRIRKDNGEEVRTRTLDDFEIKELQQMDLPTGGKK